VRQIQQTQESHAKPGAVEVDVRYLPAAHPFHQPYPPETTLETVRTAAMGYFGVQDRTERDTYRYYLGFEGQRVTDTSQTLGGLLGEHPPGGPLRADRGNHSWPGGVEIVDPYPPIDTWVVPTGVVAATLACVREPGERGVESGVFWLGRRAPRSIVDTVMIPSGPGVEERPDRWSVAAEVYGEISRWAGPQGLSLLGILHTHGNAFPARLSKADRTRSVRAPGVLAVVVGDDGHDNNPEAWGWYVFEGDDYRLLAAEERTRRITMPDGAVSVLRASLDGVKE
jgi:hypothetical protein